MGGLVDSQGFLVDWVVFGSFLVEHNGEVPLTGWIQIIVFCGMVDFGLYRCEKSPSKSFDPPVFVDVW